MCSFEQLEIDLREVGEGLATMHFDLGNDFFEALEDAEIKRGSVAVDMTIRRSEAYFDIRLHVSGVVSVPCDLCLEDMSQPVEGDGQVAARLGAGGEGDDELVVVDDEDGLLSIAWPVYESIVLAVPTRHVHEEGQCNPDMERLLHEHSASAQDRNSTDGGSIDPRWLELEKLKTIIKD